MPPPRRFPDAAGRSAPRQLPDHFRAYPQFLAEVTRLLANGANKYREAFVDGFETLPASLSRLFEGAKRGKLIVRA